MQEGIEAVKNVKIEDLADAVMEGLTEYSSLVADSVKQSVKDAGKTVKNQIKDTAPEKTGRYAKSWTSRTTGETANSIEVTVYSPSRYMLAHLLEHGHVKRNGGRTRAFPHIAPAEEEGVKQLQEDIQKQIQRLN